MKENVGKKDRLIRSITGPALVGIGYLALGGDRGRIPGLVAMGVGLLISESAVTKVCPVNALLGLDTRKKHALRRIKKALT